MNHNKKKTAVDKYSKLYKAGDTLESIRIEIEADPKGHEAEEIDEILEAIAQGAAGSDDPKKGSEGSEPAPKKEASKSKYPLYDLWKVDVENLQSDKSGEPKKVRFTAIKKLREAVKIEDNVAALLNAQSHNSRRRYYLAGSVTNGAEEVNPIN